MIEVLRRWCRRVLTRFRPLALVFVGALSRVGLVAGKGEERSLVGGWTVTLTKGGVTATQATRFRADGTSASRTTWAPGVTSTEVRTWELEGDRLSGTITKLTLHRNAPAALVEGMQSVVGTPVSGRITWESDDLVTFTTEGHTVQMRRVR